MEVSTAVTAVTEWPKEWIVPKKARTIRLDDRSEIGIPYIIKNRVLLKEGVANGIFYPGEEIEPLVDILNKKPATEDVKARNRTSVFWDHDDACKNWLGEIKNFRWDSEAKALIGDIYLVDEAAAKKTHYQLKEDLSRWGVSPRVRIDEKDGKATNIQAVTFALVMDPAGGPKLMLEKEKFDYECAECGWKITSETPSEGLKCEKCGGQMQRVEKSEPEESEETQSKKLSAAWVCKKCGYSEAVEKGEEKEKMKECPECKGEMGQKQEARGSIEELYTDLELEPEEEKEEKKEKMEFDRESRAHEEELSALSEQFGLSQEEISQFSDEQLNLLRNVPAEAVGDPQKTYKKPPEKEARRMFTCPLCGVIEPLGGKTEKECPRCTFSMEIKEIRDETSKELAGDKTKEVKSMRKRIEGFAPLIKIDEDEHIVKMIVLEPDVADNYNHVVSATEIRNAMYMWMEHYRNCEVMHRDKGGNLFPLEQRILSPEDPAWRQGWNEEFAILECYQAPTDYFENDQVVRKDSWILTLRVKDNEIWRKIKNKELTGASMGGHGALTSEAVA